ERLPDTRKLLTRQTRVHVRAEADAEEDGVRLALDRAQRLRARDRRAEAELDAQPLEHPRLCGQRLTLQTIGRDRVAGQPARLRALVVDGDGVAARGELARTDDPRRAGADHGHAVSVARRRRTHRGLVL